MIGDAVDEDSPQPPPQAQRNNTVQRQYCGEGPLLRRLSFSKSLISKTIFTPILHT
jgi:hypothetical protein